MPKAKVKSPRGRSSERTGKGIPLGMAMPGRTWKHFVPNSVEIHGGMKADGYKHGFNDERNEKCFEKALKCREPAKQENDTETSLQDYGFRMYAPLIARFISVDSLSADYSWWTPYQFAGNCPIWAVDIDGLEPDRNTDPANQPVEARITPIPPVFRTPIVPTSTHITRGVGVAVLEALGNVAAVPLLVVAFVVGFPVTANAPSQPRNDIATYQPPQPVQDPAPTPLSEPKLEELPDDHDKPDSNPKKFWVVYTKTKENPDGTKTVYSGRSSGYSKGKIPTPQELQSAVDTRERGHKILNAEGYNKAELYERGTDYKAIRGLEQQLIDYHGGAKSDGGTSRNAIRGHVRPSLSIQGMKAATYKAAAITLYGQLPNNNPKDNKSSSNEKQIE